MNEKNLKFITGSIINVFNPFIVPTCGFLLIINQIPGVEFYSFRLKAILILIVLLSSCILPLTFIGLITKSHLSTKIMSHVHDRVISYFFTAFSIFLGAQLLGKLPVPGLFKFLMMGSCILIVFLIAIAVRWEISGHTSAFGGLTATMVALSLKYGMDLLPGIIIVLLVSGLVSSALIYKEKNNPAQVYTGFALGFIVLFSLITFV